MRLSRAACQLLAASCALLVAASACGNTSGSNVAGNGDGTGNGSGAAKAGSKGTAGTSGLNGPDLGNLGGASDTSGGIDDPTMTCAGDLIEAKHIPLDMYVMLDASGSMLDPTEGDAQVSKWQAVSSALSDFVNDPASEGMGMGLQVFPLTHPDAPAQCTTNQQCGAFGDCFLKTCWNYPGGLVPCRTTLDCGIYGPCVTFGECANDPSFVCNSIGKTCGAGLGNCVAPGASICLETADCRPASYAAPAAPIADLPGAKDAVLAAINRTMPDGLTPSGPALQGALQQAATWAKAHPERQVVVVLATDGLPTLCDPLEIVDVAGLAADGRAATPATSTFVIGVFGPADADAPDNLHAIAQAGGTNEAFIVDTQGNVATQFRDALNQIRASRLSCELAVPQADAGKSVDYQQVNVAFDDGNGPTDLFYVGAASGCDPTKGGWYFDKDPDAETPERIIACPKTCGDFGEAESGSVQIKLGCPRRDVVK